MPDELVFTVEGAVARPADAITLEEAGLRERAHLQEWIVANPQMLGPDVRIVAVEFGQWTTGEGARENDRLDVLGLDRTGQLVIAELKRGWAPDTVDMQAIKYAAMASRFSVSDLVRHHARFLQARTGQPCVDDEVRDQLLAWAEDLSDESLRLPRIVLLAAGFSPVVTATCVFLREVGLDIALVRHRAFRTPRGEVIIATSQLFPLPDVEQFTVKPEGPANRQLTRERKRESSAVSRLLAAQAIEPGTTVRFRVDAESDPDIRARLREWLEQDSARGVAHWQQAQSPLVWKPDGRGYLPTSLVKKMIEEATGTRPESRWGSKFWCVGDRTLVDLADTLRAQELV